MITWYRSEPAYAEIGQPITIEILTRNPAHITLQITTPDDTTLPAHDATSQPLAGMYLHTWRTDPIPTPGVYLIALAPGGPPAHGFWTRDWVPSPTPSPPPPLPPPPLPPPSTDFPLRGVHDVAGADWLLDNGLEGWCTMAVYLNTDPRDLHLEKYALAGIRILVNLRYSYATDDGGQGTMPAPDRLNGFEQACIETMRRNPTAWGFIYCNEFNNDREHPAGFKLTPAYYRDSYNRMWAAKPANTRLIPGAIDPFNPGWGDWRITWRTVLSQITGCDGLALHAYTHGPALHLIHHDKRFSHDPLQQVFYDLRVLESQQEIIPARFQDKPQIVTETNHLLKRDGGIGWEPDAGEWVRQALAYLAGRGVVGACLFRFNYCDWSFGHLPDVLNALK